MYKIGNAVECFNLTTFRYNPFVSFSPSSPELLVCLKEWAHFPKHRQINTFLYLSNSNVIHKYISTGKIVT